MRRVLTILALCLCTLPVLSQPNQIITEYDKFKDQTVIGLELIFVGGNLFEGLQYLKFLVACGFPGKEMKETPKSILCIFEVTNGENDPADEIIFLVNNVDRIRPARFIHKSTVREEKQYRHSYVATLPYTDFIKVAYGQAEFKLGTFIGKTNDDQRKLLRDFDLKISKK